MPKFKIRLEQRLIYEGSIEASNEEYAREFAEQLAATSGSGMGYDPTLVDDTMTVTGVYEVVDE